MRTIYYWCFLFVSLAIETLKAKRLMARKNTFTKGEYETKINTLVSKWSLKQLKNSGSTIHVKGHENIPKEAVLFVSNHQGNFDTAIFLSYVNKNKGYIAKKEMLKFPFIGVWMQELRCVAMDRGDLKQSLQAILEGIKILKDGYSLVIFPEGTRSLDGKMKPFKAGSFKLATKSGVPIVPVTIDGSHKMLKSGTLKINPTTVYVTIHPPLEVKNLTKDEQAQLPQQVQGIIQSALKN